MPKAVDGQLEAQSGFGVVFYNFDMSNRRDPAALDRNWETWSRLAAPYRAVAKAANRPIVKALQKALEKTLANTPPSDLEQVRAAAQAEATERGLPLPRVYVISPNSIMGQRPYAGCFPVSEEENVVVVSKPLIDMGPKRLRAAVGHEMAHLDEKAVKGIPGLASVVGLIAGKKLGSRAATGVGTALKQTALNDSLLGRLAIQMAKATAFVLALTAGYVATKAVSSIPQRAKEYRADRKGLSSAAERDGLVQMLVHAPETKLPSVFGLLSRATATHPTTVDRVRRLQMLDFEPTSLEAVVEGLQGTSAAHTDTHTHARHQRARHSEPFSTPTTRVAA